MFYKKLKKKFSDIVIEKKLPKKRISIKTRALKPGEATGKPDRDDFPLLEGKEVLMEATFGDVIGQAYTDAPSEFSGVLKDIIGLELTGPRQRALFIAALNAVMRYIYPDLATIHCKDNEPEECAKEMIDFIRSLRPDTVGLIGLQPAILESLVTSLGTNAVLCVDRNEKNRGQLKFSIPVEWGDNQGMEKLIKKSAVVLATGSTVVNGSIKDILDLAAGYSRPVFFYGTTIAGTARLMDLNHLCFKSKREIT